MEKKESDLVILKNSRLSLHVARTFGPRIIALQHTDGPNILAELPDFKIKRPDGKIYRFYGGHRLWLAPEDPIGSYALDEFDMEITQTSNSLHIQKPVEQETGIEKSIQITLADGDSKITLVHTLTNRRTVPVKFAPWAITQLRPGGVAILPQILTPTDLLPNRVIALWPYTDISSPHVTWGNRFILLRSEHQSPFKIGFPNPRGWLGYWLEGTLFVKRAPFFAGQQYLDFGSSSECYCNQYFLELETIGPLATLLPGTFTSHTETWELHRDIVFPGNEEVVREISDKLGLE